MGKIRTTKGAYNAKISTVVLKLSSLRTKIKKSTCVDLI